MFWTGLAIGAIAGALITIVVLASVSEESMVTKEKAIRKGRDTHETGQ